MNSIILCVDCLKTFCDLVTALSTFGLLLFTIRLAIIAFDTFKSSEKSNRLQGIKDTIFKLIDFHYKIIESIEVINIKAGITSPGISRNVSGTKAFESLFEELKDIYKKIDAKNNATGKKKIIETVFNSDYESDTIKEAFFDLYNKHSQIGNYYKNLYLLIEYIDMKAKQNIVDFDSEYYIRLIKAQLSKYEILLLAYNCIWIYGETEKEEDKEFLEFAVKYKLLSALEKGELIKSEHQILLESYNK